MFLGKFYRTLDANGRFPVPDPFRGSLDGRVYVTQGFDRNLQVLTESAFQGLYRAAASLNIADPRARMLLRLLLGTAHPIQLDARGHFTIPEELKQYANLKDEIVVIGQGEYFEVWSPEAWSTQEAQLRDAESNGARFAALAVTTG